MSKNRNLVLFIAMSLDGYIATEDESLDWLYNVEGDGDNGYSRFYETVDTVIMGKKTYDWMMTYAPDEFPYKGKECYVFTRSINEDTQDVKFINNDIVSFINDLKKQERGNIWLVGGGDLLTTFTENKLIDELIITLAPKIIGKGIPLFNQGDYQSDLILKGTRKYNQFVELHYLVKK